MGSKLNHIPVLKKFLKDHYKGYEKDVFSAFIDRGLAFSKPHGRLGFMSPFVWMFISSHEHLRTRLMLRQRDHHFSGARLQGLKAFGF